MKRHWGQRFIDQNLNGFLSIFPVFLRIDPTFESFFFGSTGFTAAGLVTAFLAGGTTAGAAAGLGAGAVGCFSGSGVGSGGAGVSTDEAAGTLAGAKFSTGGGATLRGVEK